MKYSYIIIDDHADSLEKTLALAQSFPKLDLVGTANNYEDGLNLILEHNPSIVFLEIDPQDKQSKLSLALINELYRYLHLVPRIIVTTSMKELAYDAIRHEVFDYLIKPLELSALRRTIFKLEKMPSTVSEHLLALNATSTSKREPVEATKDLVEPPLPIIPKAAAHDIIVPAVEKPTESASPSVLPAKQPESESAPASEETDSESGQLVEESIKLDEHSTIAEISEISVADSISIATNNLEAGHNGVANKNIESISLNGEKKPLIICVKSYGDYRFIEAKEISYLKADNNSTDIHLQNGEMITAFKTLKHFEAMLNLPFIRIHNSYIVNINYVSRIHTGNSVCYIKNTNIKLPFSKSYKENIDSVISTITMGNYLEF